MKIRGISQTTTITIAFIIIGVLAVSVYLYTIGFGGPKDTEPPTAQAGDNQIITVGEEVALDGSWSTDNVGITDYQWDLGDGSTASGVTFQHSYSEAGTYTITLTVKDEAGNSHTDIITIDVAEPKDETPPIAYAGPDLNATVGETFIFDAVGSSDNVGIVGYEWDFGDGSTASGVVSQHEYTIAGTYMVTLTVRDAAGNVATDTLEVVVEETAPPVEDDISPIAEAGPDLRAAVGETLEFDASASTDNIGIVSYTWDFGDGETATGITASHAYDEQGNYTVTLVVRDEAGNSDSDILTVTVTEAKVAPTIDGTIEEGEYPHTTTHSATGMTVYWYNDENEIYIGMVSPGTGWVAIGFDPGFAMNKANFVFGYVSGGETRVSDQYGTSSFTHSPDDSLGGTDDITEYAGSEASGKTTIELRMPLDSGDPWDKPLKPGNTYTVRVAYQSSADDFNSKHTKRGSITISLD